MEIHFLISNNSKLKYKMYPIEVKSTKRYSTVSLILLPVHLSLHSAGGEARGEVLFDKHEEDHNRDGGQQ